MTRCCRVAQHHEAHLSTSPPTLQWNDFTVGQDFVCGIRNSGDTYCMGIDTNIGSSDSTYSGESDTLNTLTYNPLLPHLRGRVRKKEEE